MANVAGQPRDERLSKTETCRAIALRCDDWLGPSLRAQFIWTFALGGIVSKTVKYFYAATFFGAGAFFLTYVFHFARNGEVPVRGATFERRTNAPAFWLFTMLFTLGGLGCMFGAVAILFSNL